MNNVETIINQNGERVAVDLINKYELDRHNLVKDIFNEIEELEKIMIAKNREIDQKIEKFLKNSARKNKSSNEWKGNIELNNYSHTKQVLIRINNFITFDERLNLAKNKIDSCIKRWIDGFGENSNAKFVSEIARQAFNVDKKGAINKVQILKLLRINIIDREWVEAQKLIQASITTETTKRYKNYRVREMGEKWETKELNLNTFQ